MSVYRGKQDRGEALEPLGEGPLTAAAAADSPGARGSDWGEATGGVGQLPVAGKKAELSTGLAAEQRLK